MLLCSVTFPKFQLMYVLITLVWLQMITNQEAHMSYGDGYNRTSYENRASAVSFIPLNQKEALRSQVIEQLFTELEVNIYAIHRQ